MRDLHMHSVFSDGKNTPEEMIRAAADLGMDCVGLSDHSYTEQDECAMTPEGTLAYREEITRLKKQYAGTIRVLCGLERDYYSDDTLAYDYVIGSVHFLQMPDGRRITVDWQPEQIKRDVDTYYLGDWYALAEDYFRLEGEIWEKTRCNIIGHFDLLTKYNEQERWFDTTHPRYRQAWQTAADRLLKTGAVFEVNTGAIARGFRTDAYPSAEIRAYLRERGGKMILSSDAHRRENIGFAFDRFQEEMIASF